MSYAVAILGGGLAMRLRPLTNTLPKALVEVAGEPFLAHQIALLRRSGLRRLVLCVGYLGAMIEAAFSDGRALGVEIEYVSDGGVPLGTAGALRHALPRLGDVFLVLNGDTYLDIDYGAVATAFTQSGALGLMTVSHNDGQSQRSNVHFVDGRIVSYDKQWPTPDMQHIDAGVGVMHKKALAGVPDDAPSDLAKVHQDLIARGQLSAFEVTERFYDIGSPEGLRAIRRHLRPTGC